MGKSPVKILRVITRLNIGGPSRHVMLLTEAFNQNGMRSQLISGTPSAEEGNFHAEVEGKGIPFYRLPELGREVSVRKDLAAFFRLLSLFLKERPQIVHTHMAKAGTLGRLAALCAGVPIRIHTYHGHVFHDYFSRPKTRLFLAVERMLARTSHRLIAVSDAVRDELCHRYRIGSTEKVEVIPLGLELDPFLESHPFRGALRRELGLAEGIHVVGIVGRLAPIKDHSFFLSVASNLLKRRWDVRFVVVGDGELRKGLEQKVKQMGLSKEVLFLGWRTDLERVYPDLDVVVLTSKNEGTPVSLIEAMACARPVVATRVGGVPDVVREGVTGFLVPPGETQIFCQRLESLLDNVEKRRAFGERGREWVRQRYSKERLVSDMKSLYNRLIEKHCEERIGIK